MTIPHKDWPHKNKWTRTFVDSVKHRSPDSLTINHDLILDVNNGAEVHVGGVPMTKKDFDYLKDYGFEAVLDLCCDNSTEHEDCLKLGIIQLSEYVDDGHSPTPKQFDTATLFIQSNLLAGRNVYIHCHAGAGRAPTVACAWLIRYYGLSVDDALAHLKLKRRYHFVSENQIEGLIEFAYRHARTRHTKGGE